MKKLLLFIMSTSLVFALAGCSNANKVNYKDGVYSADGDKWQYGYESSTVTIKDGKINDVVLKRLNLDGTEVDYNQWTGAKDASGKTYPNLKQFRIDTANKMKDKQTYNVDTISGATTSTKNWIVATQRALDNAKK